MPLISGAGFIYEKSSSRFTAMRQLIQNLKNGATVLEEVPVPAVQPGRILVRTHRSLVSQGTEKMLLDFGKAGWIEKARQQPDKVKQVLEKIQTDGLKPTLDAVRSKLDQALPLGYSNAGVVLAAGQGVQHFKAGDRVATNGPHAEVVSVPENLAALIPDAVSDEEAAFAVIGAIALQGIRLVQPSLGETFIVTGLGLIGQLTLQLLRANGCHAIGLDIDEEKLRLARSLGFRAENPEQIVPEQLAHELTGGHGVDGVLITASSRSNDLVAQAAHACRKRGRIVLVGVIGLHLNRSDFYEKELSFQVSCSYGPGRYDAAYEQKGLDYPIGFVRWTEQRNFEAILQAIATGRLDVRSLITERVPLHRYQELYGELGSSGSVAGILEYDADASLQTVVTYNHSSAPGKSSIGLIGAGNFTQGVVLPLLKKLNAPVQLIASANGLSAAQLARRFRIPAATSDPDEILRNADIDTVWITTRHHLHAAQVAAALQAGKHVFVEKPLAINATDLEQVEDALSRAHTQLCVGFNRRFAPLALKVQGLLGTDPLPFHFSFTINAGAVPPGSWLLDRESGGGRIVGELCHFLDLAAFWAGIPMEALCASGDEDSGNVSLLLRFQNGTQGTINYFTRGSRAYPKERYELFQGGRVLVLNNWKKLEGYGFRNFSSATGSQDKGHEALFRAFLQKVKEGGCPLVPYEALLQTTRATFAVEESLRSNSWVSL